MSEVKATVPKKRSRTGPSGSPAVRDRGLNFLGHVRNKRSWKRRFRVALLALMGLTGLLWLWRFVHRGCVGVLMIHGVMEDDGRQEWVPLRPRLSPQELDRYLGHLSCWYRFISVDEAVEMLAGKAPMRRHSLVMTFDDGCRNNLTHALPILRKYQVPGIIFLATGHVERQEPFWFDRLDYALQHGLIDRQAVRVGTETVTLSSRDRDDLQESYRRLRALAKGKLTHDDQFQALMSSLSAELEAKGGQALRDILCDDDWSAVATWEEVAAAAKNGVCFGSHTVNHVRLPGVSRGVAQRELAVSKQAIERYTGQPCRYLAYPNGDVDETAIAVARDVGYLAAFTTEEGLNKLGDDPLQLRRIDLSSGLSRLELHASVSGLSCALAGVKETVSAALRGALCHLLRKGGVS